MSLVQIKEITKSYGKNTALKSINLDIEEKKIYGLLGRNGAGKTTLLNLMTNKIFPDSGEITLEGKSVFENDEILNNIFYMMEKNLYPEAFKVKEIFKITKGFYPEFDHEYAKSLADKFQLNINKKIKELSTGYSSIFKAIIALASNAKLVVLDEPVLGLDANHRDLLYKEILTNYIEKPKTVIISTHLIEEISDLLEEVIIIKEGEIVLNQPIEEILTSAYTVSGEASKIDEYISNRRYVGVETMGRFKSATILEPLTEKDRKLIRNIDLQTTKAELQKLFISLTNS